MARRNILLAAAGLQVTSALQLDTSDSQSIRDAAATIAKGTVAVGVDGAGLFPFPPYYWWESGAVWGGLIDYYSYTGDDAYLEPAMSALSAQTGPNFDYIPPAQADNEANDDQAVWIFSVLDALEQGLPPLSCSSQPCANGYLEMADNAFNQQTGRWDASTCGGGLRWQYNPSLMGYDYKNAITNGGLFNIAARLARYTGNTTYADWASKVWDWEASIGLIDDDFHVHDGSHLEDGCASVDPTQWTYSNGIHMHGAAMMYDFTGGGDLWRSRVQGLLDAGTETFFSPFSNATNVMYEQRCELPLLCTTDQTSFKAFLARFWGKTTILAPFTAGQINPILEASAKGAAASCSGSGSTCGMAWWYGGFDGTQGLGQQISALETVQALLVGQAPAPRKAGDGSQPATSSGSQSGGSGGSQSGGSDGSQSGGSDGSQSGGSNGSQSGGSDGSQSSGSDGSQSGGSAGSQSGGPDDSQPASTDAPQPTSSGDVSPQAVSSSPNAGSQTASNRMMTGTRPTSMGSAPTGSGGAAAAGATAASGMDAASSAGRSPRPFGGFRLACRLVGACKHMHR